MKRRDLIKRNEADGAVLARNGYNHDRYINEQTRKSHAVPRYREIHEWLVRDIIKELRTPSD